MTFDVHANCRTSVAKAIQRALRDSYRDAGFVHVEINVTTDRKECIATARIFPNHPGSNTTRIVGDAQLPSGVTVIKIQYLSLHTPNDGVATADFIVPLTVAITVIMLLGAVLAIAVHKARLHAARRFALLSERDEHLARGRVPPPPKLHKPQKRRRRTTRCIK